VEREERAKRLANQAHRGVFEREFEALEAAVDTPRVPGLLASELRERRAVLGEAARVPGGVSFGPKTFASRLQKFRRLQHAFAVCRVIDDACPSFAGTIIPAFSTAVCICSP
jgi:hypothetical protein